MSTTPNQQIVLLIEADILARVHLGRYLRECGFKVIEASCAAEAEVLLGAGGGGIDILLADVGDHSGDAFSFVGRVRHSHPGVEVVLAGSSEAAAAKAAELCERGPRTRAPYDHQLVVDRIRRMRAGLARSRESEAGERSSKIAG